MNSYVISYDLRNDRDYDNLYIALKAYPDWGHVLESVWVIKSDDSATLIRDHLKSKMDNDDGLLVVKSTNVAAWSNVVCENDWLKENI